MLMYKRSLQFLPERYNPCSTSPPPSPLVTQIWGHILKKGSHVYTRIAGKLLSLPPRCWGACLRSYREREKQKKSGIFSPRRLAPTHCILVRATCTALSIKSILVYVVQRMFRNRWHMAVIQALKIAPGHLYVGGYFFL